MWVALRDFLTEIDGGGAIGGELLLAPGDPSPTIPPMLVALVLAALTAVVAVVGWLQARQGWARERALKDVFSRELAEAQHKNQVQRIELDELRDVRARLTRELELERGNVRKLVPVLSTAKPGDNSAGFARMAFRAWILWFNDCPIVVPFRTLLASSDIDANARVLMACELYARAIMESALAAHLDGSNPRSDRAVLEQLASALGDSFAERVAADVALRGVTFSSAAPQDRPASEASEPASASPLPKA